MNNSIIDTHWKNYEIQQADGSWTTVGELLKEAIEKTWEEVKDIVRQEISKNGVNLKRADDESDEGWHRYYGAAISELEYILRRIGKLKEKSV